MGYYNGPEIISEIVFNTNFKSKGVPKGKQRVLVKCSSCFSIKSVIYEGHVRNRKKRPDSLYCCNKCFGRKRFTQMNIENKGKSFEERLGKVCSEKCKERISKNSKERNSVKCLEKFYGMTWEEKYGKKKSIEMKKYASRNCRLIPKFGKDNPQFGKPAHKLSGTGVKGYYKDVFFRSLLEASFIHILFQNNIEFENGESKKYAIVYNFDDRERIYYSDFVIGDVLYEVKPKALVNTRQNIAKADAAKIWCMKNNKQYKIITEDEIKRLNQSEIDEIILKGDIKLL